MDETTENIEEIQQNSNLETDSSDIIEQTAPNSSEVSSCSAVSLLDEKIDEVSNSIEGLEKLVLAKVYDKLHESYYDSWTSDIRKNYGLAFALRRRARIIEQRSENQAEGTSQAAVSESVPPDSAPPAEPPNLATEPSAALDSNDSAPSVDKTEDLAS